MIEILNDWKTIKRSNTVWHGKITWHSDFILYKVLLQYSHAHFFCLYVAALVLQRQLNGCSRARMWHPDHFSVLKCTAEGWALLGALLVVLTQLLPHSSSSTVYITVLWHFVLLSVLYVLCQNKGKKSLAKQLCFLSWNYSSSVVFLDLDASAEEISIFHNPFVQLRSFYLTFRWNWLISSVMAC